jgi:thiol:disulfide interchange protein
MKKLTYTFLFLFAFLTSWAQPGAKQPVKWTTKIEKKSDTEYVITLDAVIEKSWHMYSQFTPEGGALPLEITFNNDKDNFEAVGKAQESAYEKAFNETFGVDEYFWGDKAQLKQTIKVTDPNNTLVQLDLFYQVCKEVCIQGNNFFEYDLKNLTGKEVKVFSDPTAVKAETPKKAEEVKPASVTKKAKEDDKGIMAIFFLAFFSGFAALLTPCVFPMIPMTVSIFTKTSKTRSAGIRNAIFFGLSIIIIYVILGTLVTVLFGADSLNLLSTNVWFNIIFFILLVVFAISFLGGFEIMLPNSWANKVDRQADRGGFVGILFMALALAVVSFSCTGPIVGTLLVEAASKGGIAPVVGMVGFSSALALPFMLFAMFPGWMNSLPKSGGWLNTIKVSLGFLELALAFKFLSKADLVTQSHLLEREIFLVLWIAIFGAWALYLFGKLVLPHDTPVSFISVGRLLTGLVVLSFTIYLIPGLWGAPLKLISGFPPPLRYSESPDGVGKSPSSGDLPEGAIIVGKDIMAFEDYDKGLAYAKEVGKPVMIDFTGYGCENCRKMEDNVWSDTRIHNILKDEVVLISLYVDATEELPESKQYRSEATGRKVKTVGNKWFEFQVKKYGTAAQPLYVVIDHEENSLNEPVGFTPDVEEYLQWLKEGIAKFNKE